MIDWFRVKEILYKPFTQTMQNMGIIPPRSVL